MKLNSNDQLQILIAKTWDLHGRINENITQNGCSRCSNRGQYCVVSGTSVEEREKMIAISDSLRELHKTLVYLQRLTLSQKNRRDEAIGRLKESRKILRERINSWKEKESKNDVVEEVIKFIGKGDEFSWNSKIDENIEKQNLKNGISRNRQQNHKGETEARLILRNASNIHLDVLCGRG